MKLSATPIRAAKNNFFLQPFTIFLQNDISFLSKGRTIMGTIRGELFTQQVNLDNRSYFFNVKENRNGDIFLQVVESKIKDGQDDRRAIVIFADDMQKFFGGLEESLSFIEKEQKDRKKAKAEKKAAKEAKYGKSSESSDGKKKIIRRK